MDNFFLTYLPANILDIDHQREQGLDELTMKEIRNNNMNIKKDKTVANFDSKGGNYNKVGPEHFNKRNKSDLTLGFTNSGDIVNQIADNTKKN